MATTKTSSQLDTEYKQNQADLFNRAKGIADRPYTPFEGAKIADFSVDQQALMGNVRNFFDQQNPQAFSNALQKSVTEAPRYIDNKSFLNMNVQDYMNPYVDQVIDRTFRNIDRQTDATRQKVRDDAIAKKAFGNSRRDIMEAVVLAEGERNKLDAAANLYKDAYGQGVNLMQSDVANALTTDRANQGYQNEYLGQLAKNATLGMDAYQDARTAFGSIGDAQQQQQQMFLDNNVEEFYREQGYDEKQARFLSDILYGQNVETTQTSETNAPKVKGPSRGKSMLAGAAQGYAVGGPVGAVAGAIIGGLF